MKYKVGDKVRLRSGMDVEREFYFVPEMYFGGEVEITEIKEINGELCYKIPGKKFLYKESMLELVPHEFKEGDLVELRAGLEDGKLYGESVFYNQMIFCGAKKIDKVTYDCGERCYMIAGTQGYYYTESMLKPAEGEKKPPKRLISIEVDGDKVTARERDRKGVARCSPEDNFNLADGAKLAIERMENPWPRNGDLGYVMGYVFGELVAVKTAYNDSSRAHKMQKKKKLFFRTKKQAQAFIERLEDFIKRDRGLE